MSPIICPFCEKPAPADAKFCSACGGALHLVPCARCGAVNDVTAAACYQCKAPIAGRDAGAAATAAPSAAAPKRSSHRRAVAAGTAVVVAVVALGYYGYREFAVGDVSLPPAASIEAAPTRADDGSQTATPATPPSEAPPADRVVPQPEEAIPTNVAAGAISRPRAAGAAKAPGEVPPRKEVCTPAVQALGLCTMTPEEHRRAEAVAASKATIPQPQAASVRSETASPPKAAPQEAPRAGECTEAVAALGLCKPATTQRGK